MFFGNAKCISDLLNLTSLITIKMNGILKSIITTWLNLNKCVTFSYLRAIRFISFDWDKCNLSEMCNSSLIFGPEFFFILYCLSCRKNFFLIWKRSKMTHYNDLSESLRIQITETQCSCVLLSSFLTNIPAFIKNWCSLQKTWKYSSCL